MLCVFETELSTKNIFLKQYNKVLKPQVIKKRKQQFCRIATLCFNMFSDVSLTTLTA